MKYAPLERFSVSNGRQMPQRRLKCPKCAKGFSAWIGLHELVTRCPACNSDVYLPNSSPPRSVLDRFDVLIDQHPNIDKEVMKAEAASVELKKKFETARSQLIAELEQNLSTSRSNYLKVRFEWERQWSRFGPINVTYLGEILCRKKFGRDALQYVIDPKLETRLLTVEISGTYIPDPSRSRALRVHTRELRKLVDQIAKTELELTRVQSRDDLPPKLKGMHQRSEVANARLTELKKIQKEISNLELRIRPSSKASGSKKTAISRPAADRGGLDWKGAERLARDFLRHIGHTDARLTTSGRDGGIDIVSKSVVAQVKWHVAQVGSPDLQALFGIATHEKKIAVFFAQRYSPDALRWGNKTKMALFRFTASGQIEPANATARQIS